MHPLLSNPRGFAAYLFAWLLAGAVVAAGWAAQGQAETLGVFGFVLPLALVTGAAALVMYTVCRSSPLRPSTWIENLIRRVAAAGVLAGLVSGAAALWNTIGALWSRDGLVGLSPPQWLALVGVQGVVYAVSALVHDALLAQQSLQSAAANEREAKLLAREMEIKLLRLQIDPHFLFNSLNSISALIALEPQAARAMTIDLAQFFRETLSLGERDRIRLQQELDLVQHYLAIEQRRLGDKLKLSVDVNAECAAAWIPPLLLQPLVENAIKHGIRQLDEGGCIAISATHTGRHLVLRVANPTNPSAERDTSGIGQGLRHLRERLLAQFDAPAFMDIERTPHQFTVVLTLPWNP